MSVKIRLTRLGDKHNPLYRIIVADSRNARDGAAIEIIGTYNPLTNPAQIKVDIEKADKWVKNGALPTDTARAILKKAGYVFPVKAKKVAKTAAAKKSTTTKTVAKAPAAKTAAKTTVKKEA